MDQRLSNELYRHPMCCDSKMINSLMAIRTQMAKGLAIDIKKTGNLFGLIQNKSFVPRGTMQADGSSEPENVSRGTIAGYRFDSVITKCGGQSHEGTAEIGARFREMDNNPDVGCHLFIVDSGGGSSVAVDYIRAETTIRKKPLVVFIEDTCASAAYWISSNADYIIARSENTEVGSVGTMVQFEGHEANSTLPDGTKIIRVYASKSINKNKEFEDAVNNLNIELLQTEYLDPLNEQFMASIKSDRGESITDEMVSGKIYRANQVVGSMIDAIGNFDFAIEKCVELINLQTQIVTSKPNSIMNLAELQASHPDIFAQAVELGRTEAKNAESARISAINSLGFQETAPKAYASQIASSEGVTAAFLKAARAEEKASMMLENAQESTVVSVVANRLSGDGATGKDEVDFESINKQALKS